MSKDQSAPFKNSSQLQEAIDTIVQIFDHPEAISINHLLEDGQKRTTFEITTEDIVTYELVYNGHDDEAEPELRQLD